MVSPKFHILDKYSNPNLNVDSHVKFYTHLLIYFPSIFRILVLVCINWVLPAGDNQKKRPQKISKDDRREQEKHFKLKLVQDKGSWLKSKYPELLYMKKYSFALE